LTKARDLANAASALSAVSATELGYVYGVTSAIQTQIDGKQAVNANVSTTELGYLDGVTSAIQTQLDTKLASSTAATTYQAINTNVSTTELGYLDGVTSAIQTQLNQKPEFVAGKNKIINGDFGVWQRGTSISLSSNTQVYSADRWLVTSVFSAGSSTFSQQTFTPGTAPVAGYESQYFGRITCGSTATNFNLYQKIEDVRTFAGQTVTFSFWAKSSATPQLQVYLAQSFGSGGSSNVDYYSGAVVLTSTWTRYTKTVSLSSLAGKTIGTSSNLTVGFYYDSGTINSATIDVWGFQIESGSVATPFSLATGTIATELAACQRYYWRAGGDTAYQTLASGCIVEGAAVLMGMANPVPMRIPPTSVDYSTLMVYDGSAINAVSTVSLNLASRYISRVQGNPATAPTANRPYWLFTNNSTSGYIGFSAEL